MRVLWIAPLVLVAAPAAADEATYFSDVKPILDGRCAGCHAPGGIAPFPLVTLEDAKAHARHLGHAVADLSMPPWSADPECAEYRNDRSLTPEQIDTLVDWAEGGAPAGDASQEGRPLPQVGGLSRVDVTLRMAEPYTPTVKPDEYRCFVLDWPGGAENAYVTGFDAAPDNRAIVHHLIAYLIPPEDVAQAEARDAADAGPGYTCFGDVGTDHATWLAAWAPGTRGEDLPDHSGIRVPAGAKVVLQMHYNLDHAGHGPVSDQSALKVSTSPVVAKEGRIFPWANPEWTEAPQTMAIPAGAGFVHHEFVGPFAEAVGHGRPVALHGVFLHMHRLGHSGGLWLERADGTKQCLLDVPKFDFDWQLLYVLKNPVLMQPDDRLRVDCNWDNSRGRQPVVDGRRLKPRDVGWGDGTRDEMCLGAVYATVE